MALFRFKRKSFSDYAASDPLPRRAAIVNLMILVASLSSANSAVYSTSRILYQTAKEKVCPIGFVRFLRKAYLYSILITGMLFLPVFVYIFVADSRLFFSFWQA